MKKLASVLFIFSIFFSVVFRVLAYDTALGTIESPIEGDLFEWIGNVSSYLRPLTAVGFLGVVVYGGWTRMTATGDPEKEKKSNMILTAGVVGFLIIILAPVIVKIVSGLAGLQNDLF